MASVTDLAGLRTEWDALAQDVPFRTWGWLEAWWRHYGVRSDCGGASVELFTLCVFDERGVLCGVAPWYLSNHPMQGRVVRFLGSGEVCSDHLTILCHRGQEVPVAEALAHWLTRRDSADATTLNDWLLQDTRNRWDAIELEAVDADDLGVAALARALARQGCRVEQRPGLNCWQLNLPESWEAYVAMLSKSHRKQLRRLERRGWEAGRLAWRSVEHVGDLSRGSEILVELHQKRHVAQGEPGCFSSSRFTAFHREVMLRMLRAGRLRLGWLEMDGRPVAAEYGLSGGRTWYAYQAGLDPEVLDEEPGRLAAVHLLQASLREGFRTYDFLRGDEPYKAHWRAEPRATVEYRLVANRRSAQVRHGLWRAGCEMKSWVKRYLPPRTATRSDATNTAETPYPASENTSPETHHDALAVEN